MKFRKVRNKCDMKIFASKNIKIDKIKIENSILIFSVISFHYTILFQILQIKIFKSSESVENGKRYTGPNEILTVFEWGSETFFKLLNFYQNKKKAFIINALSMSTKKYRKVCGKILFKLRDYIIIFNNLEGNEFVRLTLGSLKYLVCLGIVAH